MSVSFNPQPSQQLTPCVFEHDDLTEMPSKEIVQMQDFVAFCIRLSEILEKVDDQYAKKVAKEIETYLIINEELSGKAIACDWLLNYHENVSRIRITELDLRGLPIESLPVKLLNRYFPYLTKIYLDYQIDHSGLNPRIQISLP